MRRSNLNFIVIPFIVIALGAILVMIKNSSPLNNSVNSNFKATTSSSIFQKKGDFVIFDALLFRNKPDLSKYGIKRINVIYQNSLLDNNVKDPNARKINVNKFKNSARKTLETSHIPVCLDIEAWDLKKRDNGESILKYKKALQLYKSLNPNRSVGYYAHTQYNELAKESDVFYPSFYTYNKDTASWKRKVVTEIQELRRLDPNKKIYPFIWPQYIQNTSARQLGYTFVDPKIWAYELEVLYKYADGIVLWSHYRDRNRNFINFSDNMPWWIVTKNFIRKHGLN